MADRRIYKYVLDKSVTVIDLAPQDAVLSVGMQDDQIVVWAIRNLEHAPTGRMFASINTGQAAPEPGTYRDFHGTVTSSNGIVWHIFELYEDLAQKSHKESSDD